MLTLKQEFDQWMENYEILLQQAKKAFVSKNQKLVEDINKRILNTQVHIAICARQLKENGYTHAHYSIGSPVSGGVNVPSDTSMDLDGIDPDWLA